MLDQIEHLLTGNNGTTRKFAEFLQLVPPATPAFHGKPRFKKDSADRLGVGGENQMIDKERGVEIAIIDLHASAAIVEILPNIGDNKRISPNFIGNRFPQQAMARILAQFLRRIERPRIAEHQQMRTKGDGNL